MKNALKRIEEALNQLEKLKNTANPQPSAAKKRTYSFEIFLKTAKSDSDVQQQSDSPQPTPDAAKTPELPHLTSASNSCLLPIEQTSIEINSLAENSTAEIDDEAKFEQVLRQIQDLYYQGPIVDGWLEYYPPAPADENCTLREISFERVVDNVEAFGSDSSGQETNSLPAAIYRLCGLDASGKQWSYPCPLDQLPSVSMAIARYQQLQQLLQQKQELDQRIKAKG